jgi:hypothetical protein
MTKHVNTAIPGEVATVTKPLQILKLDDDWYVETNTGFDGPFDSYEEAEAFLRLSEKVEIARLGFAGLSLNP